MAELKNPENTEESMEDILHSIRDIIADQATEEGGQAVADKPEDQTDEVMELTEVVEVAEAEPEAEEPEAKEPTAEEQKTEESTEEEDSDDVLKNIDAALETEEISAEQPAPSPAPKPSGENLVSEAPAKQSSDALKSLVDSIPRPKIHSPQLRSGNTIEDIVVEALRPMLSEWLDENLPIIVREIVEKEIRKLIPRE